MNSQTFNIYSLFMPYFWAKKDEIINRIQNRFDDIKLIGFQKLDGIIDKKSLSKAYQEIEKADNNLDGIIVFGGFLDKELTDFELPVIFVRAVMGVGDWQKGVANFYQDEKVLTSTLNEIDNQEANIETSFQDLFDKINLIKALKRVKQTKLICIQEKEIFGNYDVFGMDYHFPLSYNYNQVYKNNLEKLGINIEHIKMSSLVKGLKRINENKIIKIANRWINNSRKVNQETDRSEIEKAARMYLAIKKLMDENNAQGVIIRSLVPWAKGLIDVTPCLANTEFNRQLKVGVCEGLVNNAVGELLGLKFAGKPSFIGDVVGIDTINSIVTFAHCQSPINPHGDKTVPYDIRSHALQKKNRMLPDYYPEIGKNRSAAVKVDFPINDTVTIFKMSLYDQKIAVSRGKTVFGSQFYRDFDDSLCRTKLSVRMNASGFEQNYNTTTFGVHRNILFGDYTKPLQQIAKLIGYNIIEEVKS